MAAKSDEKRRSLGDDQRGAIMVMGVFMAMLMVGFVYYVAGLGETLLFREHMQDAVDAAAWSGAVIHARGMNIVALINMIMAALVAVLIALNMLVAACKAAIVIGGVMTLFPPTSGIGAAIVGVAEPLEQSVSEVRDTVKDVLEDILPVLTKANRAVKVAMPVIAEAKVVYMVSHDWGNTADFGFFYGKTILNGGSPKLPLEDDECEVLETKGEAYIEDLVREGLGDGVLGDIVSKILGALGDLASFTEGSICGGGSNGGYNAQEANAQTLGEQCLGNADAGVAIVGQCINLAHVTCWGSTDSGDYPHYDEADSGDFFHQSCGSLPGKNCAEVDGCYRALQQANEPQPQDEESGDVDGGDSDIAPQRVASDVNLGDGWFQIHAVVIGDDGHLDGPLHNVRTGNWGHPVSGQALDNVEFLTRVSVAQAEYYFDEAGADGLRDEWMWHMQWRARMRRFSVANAESLQNMCTTYSNGGGACSSISGITDTLSNALVH